MKRNQFRCQMTLYKKNNKPPTTRNIIGLDIQEIVDQKLGFFDQHKQDPDVEVITFGDIIEVTTETLPDTNEVIMVKDIVTNPYFNMKVIVNGKD